METEAIEAVETDVVAAENNEDADVMAGAEGSASDEAQASREGSEADDEGAI
ncbi:MAG: hypothetical protein GYA65_06845 [Actinobacteria bacterium]|nr:hypothetical protein [Actinomycetota bacterium]